MSQLTDNEKRNLSKNLHLLLEKYHLTIPFVAQACNLRLRTFESYYYGEKSPSLERLNKLAIYFNLTPTALIAEELSSKLLEQKVAFREVQELLHSEAENTLIESINIQFKEIHFSVIQMFKDLGFEVDFIPTFTNEEFQSLLYTDEFTIDAYKKYCEIYDKRFVISPDASEEARQTVERLKTMLIPEREQYLLEHVGLDLISNNIENNVYSHLTEIPLKVRISTINENIDRSYITSKSDMLYSPKEYSLLDLKKLEGQLIDTLYNFLDT